MIDPTNRSAANWQTDLDRSEAEIAAGRVVSMAPGRARLRETVAELASGGHSRGRERQVIAMEELPDEFIAALREPYQDASQELLDSLLGGDGE